MIEDDTRAPTEAEALGYAIRGALEVSGLWSINGKRPGMNEDGGNDRSHA
jgi:hypothetical protein